MMFAHWNAYELIVVHNKDALPRVFVEAHGASACVHFVESDAEGERLGLFSARYHNALLGMSAGCGF